MMNIMIEIFALIYGIAISLWFLFIDRNESEGLKKNITAMFLMLNSVLLIIFAIIGLLKIFELSNFEGTLILLGIAMIQNVEIWDAVLFCQKNR